MNGDRMCKLELFGWRDWVDEYIVEQMNGRQRHPSKRLKRWMNESVIVISLSLEEKKKSSNPI